jgi:hypothetical protein
MKQRTWYIKKCFHAWKLEITANNYIYPIVYVYTYIGGLHTLDLLDYSLFLLLLTGGGQEKWNSLYFQI